MMASNTFRTDFDAATRKKVAESEATNFLRARIAQNEAENQRGEYRLIDTSDPAFVEECRRQWQLVAQADEADTELQQFMDALLADMMSDGEWTAQDE